MSFELEDHDADRYFTPPTREEIEAAQAEERAELAAEAAKEGPPYDFIELPDPPIEPEPPVEVAGEEGWRQAGTLPDQDNMRRDWSRINRKLGYIYPEVVLPSWRRSSDWS